MQLADESLPDWGVGSDDILPPTYGKIRVNVLDAFGEAYARTAFPNVWQAAVVDGICLGE